MESRNRRKVRKGVVVSDKMDKTVVVSCERVFQHPLYRKLVKRTDKVVAHDEENRCRVGDSVTIIETRPLSRRKRWRVSEVVSAVQTEAPSPGGAEGEGEPR
jgi:small subunit ribosomal protein S17